VAMHHTSTAPVPLHSHQRSVREGLPVEQARELARKWHLEHATFDLATLAARDAVRTREVTVPRPGGVIPFVCTGLVKRPPHHCRSWSSFVGGRWVIGDLDTHHQLCRELCWPCPAVVATLDTGAPPRTGSRQR
jgi:acetyl esterase/lipase